MSILNPQQREAIMANSINLELIDILDEHLRSDGNVDQVCLWSDGSCSIRTVSKDDSWLFHEESQDHEW